MNASVSVMDSKIESCLFNIQITGHELNPVSVFELS